MQFAIRELKTTTAILAEQYFFTFLFILFGVVNKCLRILWLTYTIKQTLSRLDVYSLERLHWPTLGCDTSLKQYP